jgi:hypothetical protein
VTPLLGPHSGECGYRALVARKGAWQFLNKTADPRLSMLRKVATAMGVSIKDFV